MYISFEIFFVHVLIVIILLSCHAAHLNIFIFPARVFFSLGKSMVFSSMLCNYEYKEVKKKQQLTVRWYPKVCLHACACVLGRVPAGPPSGIHPPTHPAASRESTRRAWGTTLDPTGVAATGPGSPVNTALDINFKERSLSKPFRAKLIETSKGISCTTARRRTTQSLPTLDRNKHLLLAYS